MAQLRKGGSLRRTTPSRNSQRRVTASTIDTCPMVSTCQYPAVHAPFSHSLEQDTPTNNRQSPPDVEEPSQIPDWNPNTIHDYNRRWSIMSMEQQTSVSPTHQYSDLQYLSTQPASQPAYHPPTRPIRCQCGHTSDFDQAIIQCISCTQFLHTGCNPTAVPGHFTCFLCTKPTSRPILSRTGSRIRS